MRPDRPTSTNGPDPLYAIGAADLAGNIAITDRLLVSENRVPSPRKPYVP